MLSAMAGVYTFHHDPGELSAAFVWERTVRLFLSTPPPSTVVRYACGGWGGMVAPLERRLRELGVEVQTGHRVDEPARAAGDPRHRAAAGERAAGCEPLQWPSGHTVCLDVGLARRRGDPWIVSDLDEAGWIGRYSSSDRSIAPEGHELIQTQMPIRPGESTDQAGARLERLLDQSVVNWRERETWRRRQVMDARSGALDPPGSTWRDRPPSIAGTASTSRATWSPPRGCSPRSPGPAALEAGRLALAAATLRVRGCGRWRERLSVSSALQCYSDGRLTANLGRLCGGCGRCTPAGDGAPGPRPDERRPGRSACSARTPTRTRAGSQGRARAR